MGSELDFLIFLCSNCEWGRQKQLNTQKMFTFSTGLLQRSKPSHLIGTLLFGTAMLFGCDKHHMTAMSEEENSFQESVSGGITILQAGHIEAMNAARVPETINVTQEAAAHGSGTGRSWAMGDSIDSSELSSVVRRTGLEGLAASLKSVETEYKTLDGEAASS